MKNDATTSSIFSTLTNFDSCFNLIIYLLSTSSSPPQAASLRSKNDRRKSKKDRTQCLISKEIIFKNFSQSQGIEKKEKLEQTKRIYSRKISKIYKEKIFIFKREKISYKLLPPPENPENRNHKKKK